MIEPISAAGRYPRFAAFIATAVLALGLSGCSENSDFVLEPGLLRVVHGIPELQELDALLDGRELSSFDFQSVSGIVDPGDSSATLTLNLAPIGLDDPEPFLDLPVSTTTGRDKTLMLTGTFENPTVTTWDQPTRDWSQELIDNPELTTLEVAFAHGAPDVGAMDVYLGELEFDPAASVPLTSTGFGEISAYQDLTSGSYELVLTPPGDPATELLRSNEISLGAANSVTFVFLDSGGVGTGQVSALLVGQGVQILLGSINLPTTMRALHAAPDTAAVDIFVPSDATEPLFTNLAFRDATDYVPSPTGQDTLINAFPTGDTSVMLSESTEDLDSGAEHTLFFFGSGGAERIIRSTDNNRRVRGVAKVRIIHGAVTLGGTIDIHIENQGDLPDSGQPSIGSLLAGASTGYVSVRPGTYDLFLNVVNSETIVGGPFEITVEGNGIYSLFTVDGPNAEMLDVVEFDDPVLTTPGG